MTRRVLFLISDTGGGHRASAQALSEALQRLHGPAVACTIVDPFAEYADWPLKLIPGAYLPLVGRHKWLWHLLWRLGEHPTTWRTVWEVVAGWQEARLRKLSDDFPADLVVSLHPMLCQAPQRTLAARQPGVRFATVVTDLQSAPQMWFNPAVDLLVASCEEVVRAAQRAGVPRARVKQLGLPIRLAFAEVPHSRTDARQQLGIRNLPTVLVMGGGEGMGPMASTVDALAAALQDQQAQIAVICGRNAPLQRLLSEKDWPLPVHILGFVLDAPLWMSAADCLITKAGPGTIAEALACSVPMILSNYVPGQETGNVAYVVRHGVGLYCPEPDAIARIVFDWLAAPATMASMRARAHLLARPHAALDIAAALSELL